MELRLPLEVSPGREATCRAVFGTWGFFPDDARASHCPLVLTSFTGWSSERCPGIGFYQEGTGKSGCFATWKHPGGHVWNVVVRPASTRGATGRSGTPSRQSRGVGPPVEIRRSKGLRGSGSGKPRGSCPGRPGCPGTLWGRIKGAKCPFDLQFLTWDFP